MSNFPTLDGLNNIEADSGNLTNITCQTFIATVSAQAPTMATGNISNNVATTEFVDDAITNAPFLTTDTTQTLTTGTKFFTNLPECSTLATTNNQFTNKAYVDGAITAGGGAFVTLSTAQTVTGNKDFTGTTRLGDALSADQPCKVSIMNSTTLDSNVGGTISGESVYNQVRFGGRGFYIAQGVDSNNQYFGVSGGGAPDADFQLTLRRGVGLKIDGAGTDTSTFTEQLKVVGTSRFTGIGTFEVSPVCAVTPTTANQLVPKNYVDNNFLALTGSQTVTGNKTFFPTTGTTIIKGAQADIFPDVCFLTGNTTTISGVNCNITSTTNFIAGTTTNIATTTLNVQNTCGNFNVNATNTNLTGTIATATTQATADNSTKLATTAYVNNYGNANYMTLTTNQNVSGVKTYSTQQIFNAGLTSNNIYASGVTDMTLGSNMGNGILNIDSSKIICDTFGVRMLNLNTQLNEGTFLQPNPSLAVGEAPSINFPTNQSQNFANTGNAGEADATKQINIGVSKFWCGNNQSSVFSLTHSLTNGYAIGPSAWQEEVITFSFVDANTGITRYTTANLADTALFSMPSLGTVIRPTITFTLDTTTLPQAVYNIFAYVRIQNAFGSNVLNTVTWNLSASPSTLVTTQDYNTYKDYTFTSRNLYHCFRNTAMCGVYIINIINNIATQNIMTPIHYSITDFTNFTFQGAVAGALTTPAVTGGTVAGSWVGLSINNADNIYLVYPNYSIILYDATGWSGVPILNFKNTTNNPVTVRPTTTQIGSSCRIYFDEVELIKY